MLKVFILTSRYPYGVGEEFFADELVFWAERSDVSVTVFPLDSAGAKRALPPGIDTNEILSLTSPLQKYRAAFGALFSRLFLTEAFELFSSDRLSFGRLKSLIACVATTTRVEKRIGSFLTRSNRPDVIYSYWNEAAAYGACLLKRKGLASHVVSRAHGADLYQERWPGSYAPLKRRFVHDFDKVYVLAPDAGKYLVDIYGASPVVVQVAPLGVKVPPAQSFFERKDKTLSVLSLSYCVPIKRIDRIVDALADVAQRLPGWEILWTHVGGGPLLEQLSKRASATLDAHESIVYRFTGPLPNAQVRALLASNSFDVIVNSSDSEGIPVSLMEAMSYGIPVIAPDVGEVKSLVSEDVGILLPAKPTPKDIGDAMSRIATSPEWLKLRSAARARIDNYFDEEKNYTLFVSSVVEVAGT